MKLYEIAQALENLEFVDKETGEVNEAMLESLEMEFEEKVENLALLIKNKKAEATAVRNEENILRNRRTRLEKEVENCEAYLGRILNGQKRKFSRVIVSFRKSRAVEYDPEKFIEWAKVNADDLLTYSTTASKTAIKDAIESGRQLAYAQIVEKESVQIK